METLVYGICEGPIELHMAIEITNLTEAELRSLASVCVVDIELY